MNRNLVYMIVVLILVIAMVSVLDSIEKTEPIPNICLSPADCQNLDTGNCEGSWGCVDNYCAWDCKNTSECTTAKDCEGQEHDDCEGAWGCQDNSCVWKCDLGNLECINDEDCIVTGCSGQVCNNEPIVSSCEWKKEYECLEYSSCGCIDNECSWKRTMDYINCIEDLSNPDNEKYITQSSSHHSPKHLNYNFKSI